MEHWTKFGNWVEQQRTARGLTKTDACKRSGVSPSSWYNIEHGGRIKDGRKVSHQPSTDTLMGIAVALDIAPEEVFGAAGLPMPRLTASTPPAPTPSPTRIPAPAPIEPDTPPGTPASDPVLVSLVAQLLAEQRELIAEQRETKAMVRELVHTLRWSQASA